KPITDILIAPITAPQIPGFRLGYFFIYRASVSEEGLPLNLSAADRGPEENSPANRRGTWESPDKPYAFRDIEFCAADQSSSLYKLCGLTLIARGMPIFFRSV